MLGVRRERLRECSWCGHAIAFDRKGGSWAHGHRATATSIPCGLATDDGSAFYAEPKDVPDGVLFARSTRETFLWDWMV